MVLSEQCKNNQCVIKDTTTKNRRLISQYRADIKFSTKDEICRKHSAISKVLGSQGVKLISDSR